MKAIVAQEIVLMIGNSSAIMVGVFALNGNAMEPMTAAMDQTRSVSVGRALPRSSAVIAVVVCPCLSIAIPRPIAWTDLMSWSVSSFPSTTSPVRLVNTGVATGDVLAKPTIATETTTVATGLMRPSVVSV